MAHRDVDKPVVFDPTVYHWTQNTIKFIINKVDERKKKNTKTSMLTWNECDTKKLL